MRATVLTLACVCTIPVVLLFAYLSFDSAPRLEAHEFETGATPSNADQLEALSERITALEAELRLIDERSEFVSPALEPASARVEAGVTREEFEAFRRDVEAALNDLHQDPGLPVVQGAFQAQVESALNALRAKERQDKVRDQQERRAERIDGDMAKLDEWLGLSSAQSGAMRAALLERYAREEELVRLWETGADDAYLGELKASDREQFRLATERALDPGQYDTFWSARQGK